MRHHRFLRRLASCWFIMSWLPTTGRSACSTTRRRALRSSRRRRLDLHWELNLRRRLPAVLIVRILTASMMGLGGEMRRVGRKRFRFVPGRGLKGTLMMGIVGESMGRKTFLEQDIPEAIIDALIGMPRAVWLPNRFKDPTRIRPFSTSLTVEGTPATRPAATQTRRKIKNQTCRRASGILSRSPNNKASHRKLS
nr:hypothetical protein Iba_chr11cCG5450 [Ipomoea batatas]